MLPRMISQSRYQELLRQVFLGPLIIIFSCAISYLVINANLIQVLGILSVALVLFLTFLMPEKALIVLLVIKPFIDLTWRAYFTSWGGVRINSLRIVGFYAFIISGWLYFRYRGKGAVFNEKIILLFILVNFFSFLNALIIWPGSFMNHADNFLRVADAYLIYCVIHNLLESKDKRLRIIVSIWMSTLAVGIISIFVFLSGRYEIDITQGVTRFAGLYNDPGTPSYMAILSLAFGTLYLEIKKGRYGHKISYRILYLITIIVTGALLIITLTKSAILMLLVFLILWFGIYKRKLLMVICSIVIAGSFLYSNSEAFRMRIEKEVKFVRDKDFSLAAARPLGTGRIAHWESTIQIFMHDYSLFQQFFGTYHNFAAHNQYIAYLMQVGYVGLLIFIIMLTRFFLRLKSIYKKQRRPEIFMALTLFAIICIYALSGHPFDYTTILWYLMISLSVVNIKSSLLL